MNQQNKTHKVLGIMSGTSLDGVDLCLAEFKQISKEWKFQIIASETYSYSTEWQDKLRNIESESAQSLVKLDFNYGKLIGSFASKFLNSNNQSAEIIASHGHTIFHQIDKGFTFQLGQGAAIAAESGVTCVCDFRSLDVALGGQGAPLVPFGDEYLFNSYKACVNLGGIANLSFKKDSERIAFDVCACNMVLNHFIKNYNGQEFDKNGDFSNSGRFIPDLFEKLNRIEFFNRKGPKSLGKEWVFEQIIPLVESRDGKLEDKLHTFSRHCAFQIAKTLQSNGISENILFTGGGSKNKFLITLLEQEGLVFQLPEEKLIDFKEALIFSFLGLNRILNKTNTLKSVTGASRDSCGGSIYLP